MLNVLIYNHFTTNLPQRSFPAHFLQNPGDQILVGPSHPTHFERVMLVEVKEKIIYLALWTSTTSRSSACPWSRWDEARTTWKGCSRIFHEVSNSLFRDVKHLRRLSFKKNKTIRTNAWYLIAWRWEEPRPWLHLKSYRIPITGTDVSGSIYGSNHKQHFVERIFAAVNF